MVLIEEGEVHADDPLEKFLPEFKGQMVIVEEDDAHPLSRRPAHGRGCPSPRQSRTPSLDLLPLAMAVRSHAMVPLLHEPDS